MEMCVQHLNAETRQRVKGFGSLSMFMGGLEGHRPSFFGSVDTDSVELAKASVWNRWFPTVLEGTLYPDRGGTMLRGRMHWDQAIGIPTLLILVGLLVVLPVMNGVGFKAVVPAAMISGVCALQRRRDRAYLSSKLRAIAVFEEQMR